MIFFFNDTATTEIYTLSLHDALPISAPSRGPERTADPAGTGTDRTSCRRTASARRSRNASRSSTAVLVRADQPPTARDRKSTRLNSSHANISYAVFCLKKKNQTATHI